jgi:translation initiation factor 4E
MSEQVDLTTIPISPTDENKPDGAATEAAKDSGETVTVFHDKDNFNVKHPLSNRWTLWFTKPASGKVPPSLMCRCPTKQAFPF